MSRILNQDPAFTVRRHNKPGSIWVAVHRISNPVYNAIMERA